MLKKCDELIIYQQAELDAMINGTDEEFSSNFTGNRAILFIKIKKHVIKEFALFIKDGYTLLGMIKESYKLYITSSSLIKEFDTIGDSLVDEARVIEKVKHFVDIQTRYYAQKMKLYELDTNNLLYFYPNLKVSMIEKRESYCVNGHTYHIDNIYRTINFPKFTITEFLGKLEERALHKYEKRMCVICEAVTKKCCDRCKSVRYCSVECQRKDYKEHKQTCTKPNHIKVKGLIIRGVKYYASIDTGCVYHFDTKEEVGMNYNFKTKELTTYELSDDE